MLKLGCDAVISLHLHILSPLIYQRQPPGPSVLWFIAPEIPAPSKSQGSLLDCLWIVSWSTHTVLSPCQF